MLMVVFARPTDGGWRHAAFSFISSTICTVAPCTSSRPFSTASAFRA